MAPLFQLFVTVIALLAISQLLKTHYFTDRPGWPRCQFDRPEKTTSSSTYICVWTTTWKEKKRQKDVISRHCITTKKLSIKLPPTPSPPSTPLKKHNKVIFFKVINKISCFVLNLALKCLLGSLDLYYYLLCLEWEDVALAWLFFLKRVMPSQSSQHFTLTYLWHQLTKTTARTDILTNIFTLPTLLQRNAYPILLLPVS